MTAESLRPAPVPEAGSPGESFSPTGRSLPIALLRAREKVMSPIREMLAGAGVTEQQWRVLQVLDKRRPLAPSEICAEACLQASSLSRIVQGLVEKGMVGRLQDTGDRRRQLVSLEPAGRAVIRANLAASRRIAREVKTRLGSERHRHCSTCCRRSPPSTSERRRRKAGQREVEVIGERLPSLAQWRREFPAARFGQLETSDNRDLC